MKKRIIFVISAFSISFVILIGLSIFTMDRFVKYIYYSNFSDTSGLVIDNIYQAELHLRDIDRIERGYIITKDTSYHRLLKNSIDSIVQDINDIDLLTDDNPKMQRDIDILRDTIALKISSAQKIFAFIDTANSVSISKHFYMSRDLMRACSRRLKIIHQEANKIRDERFNGEHIYESLATHTLTYLLLVFGLVTLTLFSIMIKELYSRLKYQEKLQSKIFDLQRSHIELEEIAYSSSHDLQEPLRKIQVFSNMLLLQNNSKIDEESKDALMRINNSAKHMQILVSDLLSLTSLTKIDETKVPVDLNRILKFLLIDLDATIREKNAVVVNSNLPIVSGYENQLKLLFKAILDNSLKFVREGIDPEINISVVDTDETELLKLYPNLKSTNFYKIIFEDNGIGFDNQFVGKMFQVFHRLHSHHSVYNGKGIGLAISQRIMANHAGFIYAEGEVGKGAKFYLYFRKD